MFLGSGEEGLGQGNDVIDLTSNLYTRDGLLTGRGVVNLEPVGAELRSDPQRRGSAPTKVLIGPTTRFAKKVLTRGELLAAVGIGRPLEVPAISGEGQGEPVAPDTNIMGATFRNPDDAKGGFDWLDACLFGTWHPQTFATLTAQLQDLRRDAEDGRQAVYVAPEGDEFKVAPHGKRGVGARWVLEGDGYSIAIVNRDFELATGCNLYVHIGSCKLMLDGIHKAWSDVLGVLGSMGFRYSRSIASRADYCVDLVGVDVRELVRQLWEGGAITKAEKGSLHWNGVPGLKAATGFNLGTDTQIRVYNKLEEVKHEPAKLAIVVDRRWDGVVPELATRVEFQLRRDSLHGNWSVTSVEDLLEKTPSIVHWLTHDWFRLVDDFDRENRNHKQAVTSTLWKKVQDAFLQVYAGLHQVKPSLRKHVPDTDALMKQMVGVGNSMLAATNEAIETAEEYADKICERVREEAARGFAGFQVKLKEFAFRATLPVGNRTGAFDDWNAGVDETAGTNVKREREDAFRRECVERQEAKDLRHGLLFDIGVTQVEASF